MRYCLLICLLASLSPIMAQTYVNTGTPVFATINGIKERATGHWIRVHKNKHVIDAEFSKFTLMVILIDSQSVYMVGSMVNHTDPDLNTSVIEKDRFKRVGEIIIHPINEPQVVKIYQNPSFDLLTIEGTILPLTVRHFVEDVGLVSFSFPGYSGYVKE